MDFEASLENLEEKRKELKKAIERIRWSKTKLITLPGSPGDIVAGIAGRAILNAVSPGLTRYLDRIGLSPGKATTTRQMLDIAKIVEEYGQ